MTSGAGDDIWRNCNICKQGIAFGSQYFLCSVSTCNRKRTGLIFCSLPCFEAHLPGARHRDAWAEPARAPSRAEWEAAERAQDESTAAAEPAPVAPAHGSERRIVSSAASSGGGSRSEPEVEIEVLVVVSKLKKYVRDWSGMNTSDAAMPILSDHLRELCRDAIRQAGLDGRRTVLDRDFVKAIAQRREGA